jgi:alkylhydroperoxidase/carboxymuconolactone decarboxylase family protein
MLDPQRVPTVLSVLRDLTLLSRAERDALDAILDDAFPFRAALARAETIHVHVRVDDVASLAHDRIRAAGGTVENQRDGYVKYAFEGGVNAIFSAIDVAEDDRLTGTIRRKRPHLDHLGIDLREESPSVRALFDEAPDKAKALSWRHVAQGAPNKPVFCCHTSVAEKHWLYPSGAAFAFPIELAYGALQIHGGKMGCDLRPIDPAHPQASQVACCVDTSHADAAPHAAASASYYERADLGRFGEVGNHAKETWSLFMAYYARATGTDTALSRREKALIALAIAHSKQCPYCIDSYTKTCLDVGATVEQMHEAVHVAAAMGAAIDLVHATQMHGTLKKHGAI